MTGEEIADQPGAADALRLNLRRDRDGTSRPLASAAQAARKLPLGGLLSASIQPNEALLFQADQWVPMRGGGGRRRKGFVLLVVGS